MCCELQSALASQTSKHIIYRETIRIYFSPAVISPEYFSHKASLKNVDHFSVMQTCQQNWA
jgi:hypothetical protein